MPVYVPKYNILWCVIFRNKSCCKSCASAFFLCELVFLSSSHVNACKSVSVFLNAMWWFVIGRDHTFSCPYFYLCVCCTQRTVSSVPVCWMGLADMWKHGGRRGGVSPAVWLGTAEVLRLGSLPSWHESMTRWVTKGDTHTFGMHGLITKQLSFLVQLPEVTPFNPVTAKISLLWMTHL